MHLQLRFSLYSVRGQRPRHRSCEVGVDQQTAASVQPPRRARVLDPQLADRRGCNRTSGVQHDARLRRFQPASTPASKSRDARCRPAVVSFRLYWPVLASYTLQPMSAGRELGHTTNAPRASGSEAGRRGIMLLVKREASLFEHPWQTSRELLMPFMGTRVVSLAQYIRWRMRGPLVLYVCTLRGSDHGCFSLRGRS